MYRYLARFRGAAPQIVVAAGLLALTGVLPGGAVWALRDATDRLAAGLPVGGPLGVLLALAVAHGGLTVARAALTRSLGWRLVHELRIDAHRAWHRLPPEDVPSAGDRLASLTQEADELQVGVSALVTALRNPVAIAVLMGSAAVLAPGLAVRFTFVLPVLAVPLLAGAWLVRGATRRWRRDRAALVAELADQHGGLTTTRDLGAADVQIARAAALSAQEASSRARMEWMRAVPSALAQIVVAAALVVLLLWGAEEVRAGRTSVGGVVGFAVALGLLQRPLAGLVEVGVLLQRSLTALERVDALLARAVQPRHLGAPPDGRAVTLDGSHVPGRVLGVSLDVPDGAKVALVGPSGSGKSSLLSVIAGHLAAPGVSARPSVLARQDPWVFDRSIADNLRLVRPDATDAELQAVLDVVGYRPSVERGLDARVGEQGTSTSGGERQRLCLARALLAGSGVLLLDEATSELDPQSAGALAAVLAAREETVVFASHDGHFAALADRVVHLDGGRVQRVEIRR